MELQHAVGLPTWRPRGGLLHHSASLYLGHLTLPLFSYYHSPWNPFSLPLLPTYCFSSKFQLQGLFQDAFAEMSHL